ncbi:MAG TPA: type II CAAX endopeptidase family protein, partial [Candidatus Saccharimonadales bacterium]|nr:type II CAAX endopeptidase family protein [Candidatus Saccharimonadales bacterium]
FSLQPLAFTLGLMMISRKPWGIEAVARLCLAIIATFCFGMLLAGLLGKLHLPLPQAQIEFLQMMISLAFFQLSALVWITVFLRRYGIGWKEAFGLGLSEPMTAAAFGILAGALFLPAAWVLQYLSELLMELAHLTPEPQAVVQALQDPSLSLGSKLLFGAAAIVLAPLAEEAVFRGILYPAIKQQGYPRLALWGTSGVFAAMHANEATLLPLLIFALVLVYLYETFGNLLAPIVAHSLFNTANFLILIFQDKIDHFLHPS